MQNENEMNTLDLLNSLLTLCIAYFCLSKNYYASFLIKNVGGTDHVTWIHSTVTILGQNWRQYEGPQMIFCI